MKRIGHFVCMVSVAFMFMVFYTFPAAFACSGCSDDTAVSAGEQEENSCFVCERGINNKGNPLEFEYRGFIFRFCSEACADTFKRDPEKYLREKACQKK